MGNSPDMATTQARDMDPSIEPVLNRVVTSDAHPLPVDILGPAETEVKPGGRKRYIITFLILLCNLTQVRSPDTGSVYHRLLILTVTDKSLPQKVYLHVLDGSRWVRVQQTAWTTGRPRPGELDGLSIFVSCSSSSSLLPSSLESFLRILLSLKGFHFIFGDLKG